MSEITEGKKKAAAVMVSIGPDVSANVFKYLDDGEIETLTFEIANMQKLDAQSRLQILAEFSEICRAKGYIDRGGLEYARSILEKALGVEKATMIIDRLTASLQARPFDFARKSDPAQLLNFIQNEHPQTIALILAYLHPDQSGIILSALPPERQVDVAKRLAMLDRTTPEVLAEIESTLEEKLSAFSMDDFTMAGGVDTAVEVLGKVDRTTERTIIDALEEDDPDLAEEIRKRMFVFDDINLLDDRSIQKVIKEIDLKDLALALKTVNEDVSRRIFTNMSKRAAETLREDIEFMGPVRLRDIEDAQQRIVSRIRKLEDDGEIIIARGGEDDVVV